MPERDTIRRRPLFAAAFITCGLMFWVLRVAYWSEINEPPFSDIADYVNVAQNIVATFTFGKPPQLLAYFTPVTPSFIALAIAIGGDHYETVFRVLVQGMAFIGATILCFELGKVARNRWIGLSFLFVLSLNRASIFWSYKLSTESVAEALLIVTSALALRVFRTRSIVSAFFSGVFGLMLALNRPQYLVPLFIMISIYLLVGFADWIRARRNPDWMYGEQASAMLRQGFALFLAAVIGVSIIWSPWIIRNYKIFHEIVPTSTSGLESFLWDTGAGPLKPDAYKELRIADGEIITKFHIRDLQQTARQRGEIESARYMSEVALAWLAANWREYPALVLSRLEFFLTTNGTTGLTKVPRDILFTSPTNPHSSGLIDLFLLDKNPITELLAALGLLILFKRSPAAALSLAALWVTPWITTALIIRAERAIEPMIVMTVWLALYTLIEFVRPLVIKFNVSREA